MFKPFSAMILAAGYGKRMLSLTKEIPKPLIKVNNIPLLNNSIDFLYRIGCKKIVINNHYKNNLISEFIQELLLKNNTLERGNIIPFLKYWFLLKSKK